MIYSKLWNPSGDNVEQSKQKYLGLINARRKIGRKTNLIFDMRHMTTNY